MDVKPWIAPLLAATMLLMGLAFSVGTFLGADKVRQDAVKANVGQYIADPTTGAVRFMWKRGEGQQP